MASSLKRPRYGSQGMTGTAKKPNVWPLPLEITWPQTKHWAKPIVLDVDPINFSDYLDAKADVMQIMAASYQMGGKKWSSETSPGLGDGWDTTMVFISTSQFDVGADDSVLPIQLAGDNDAIFKGSVIYGQQNSTDLDDMKPYIMGKQVIDVVVPTLYVYAWRGNQSFDGSATAAPSESGETVPKHVCCIYVNYKMVKLNSDAKLTDWIAQTTNASFLELIPSA